MSELRIWAFNNVNIPTDTWKDARLRGSSDEQTDAPYGQAKWDLALRYANANHLSGLLKSEKLPDHMCTSGFGCSSPSCGPIANVDLLGIVAHGTPGGVDIDARSGAASLGTAFDNNEKLLNVVTIPKYSAALTQIGNVMKPGGTIMFMSCYAARGSAGTNFLIEISKVLPGIHIAGIITMGYIGGHSLQGRTTIFSGTQSEPGMRATPIRFPGDGDAGYPDKYSYFYDKFLKNWNDLSQVPWAAPSLTSHTKIALNGSLTQVPPDDPAT
jgi:hypothetical protein